MITNFSILDYTVVLLYFALIFWISKWVSKKQDATEFNSVDYFLAGRNQGWFVIGASLFASNIGSEIIIGVSGAGARGEMPMANFELLASLILILFAWIFVPFYLKSSVYTMPEFLEKRYSPSCRNYLSIISVLAYIITKISLIIFAGALVFEVLGIPFWTGAIFTVVATGLYTVFGGLKAVIYTDMVQAFTLILGCIAVTIFGLYAVGGWDQMMTTIEMASAKETNPQTSSFFNMWKPISDTNYPWTGMLFGAPILGVWYWCTDQYIVQRALSAKDEVSARKGALFAALMSSLSSAFNSSSTLLTIDFYQKFNPDASEKQLVRFGQLATVTLVFISMGWIPFMKALMGGGIFYYLQSIQAYVSPPIAAVFLLGLMYQWVNAKASIITLWSGFALGMLRLVLEYVAGADIMQFSQGSLFNLLLEINFLHYAILLFVISVTILVTVSKLTHPPNLHQIQGLCLQTSEKRKIVWSSMDVRLSMGLIGLVLILWFVFSKWGIA